MIATLALNTSSTLAVIKMRNLKISMTNHVPDSRSLFRFPKIKKDKFSSHAERHLP
jgi:hypothetical protein